MADGSRQYLEKLAFLEQHKRAFPFDELPDDPADLTREQKASITRAYNKARLAVSTNEIANKPTAEDYAEMARVIRPFTTGFDAKGGYDLRNVDKWTRGQKAKLTRYFKQAVELGSRPFEMYWSSDKERMKVARETAGQPKGFPAFSGVMVPVQTLGERVSISVDKEKRLVEIDTPTHKIIQVEWSDYGIGPDEFMADPEGAAAAVIADLQEKGYQKFAITAGAFSVGKGVPILFTPRYAAENVKRLVEKYGDANYDPDDPNSHHYSNWLFGMRGYRFDNRATESSWRRQTGIESAARKRYKSIARKRARYRQARK